MLSVGFTLVELMVTITILTAIILIVGNLLADARQAVKLSQGTITADADARSAVDRMRADLAGLTSEGFLAIYTDTDSRQHLVFTTVGPYRSMVDSTIIANAARIDYGVTDDDDKIFWRRAILLNAANTATTADDDHEQISLADYKAMDSSGIDSELGNFTNAPSMTLPPNSLTAVNRLWPYLVAPCTRFVIEWAGGGSLTWNNSDATWTHEDKTNWPSALRFTFTLGEGDTERTYEVIVDLPR